jgi:hypothetical protein
MLRAGRSGSASIRPPRWAAASLGAGSPGGPCRSTDGRRRRRPSGRYPGPPAVPSGDRPSPRGPRLHRPQGPDPVAFRRAGPARERAHGALLTVVQDSLQTTMPRPGSLARESRNRLKCLSRSRIVSVLGSRTLFQTPGGIGPEDRTKCRSGPTRHRHRQRRGTLTRTTRGPMARRMIRLSTLRRAGQPPPRQTRFRPLERLDRTAVVTPWAPALSRGSPSSKPLGGMSVPFCRAIGGQTNRQPFNT